MRLTIFTILALCSIALYGQPEVGVVQLQDSNFVSKSLLPFTTWLTDPNGALTIQDILAGSPAFSKSSDPARPTQYPAAQWLKIQFAADEDISDRWLIFKGDNEQYPYLAALDFVDAYFVKDTTVEAHYRSGYFVPRREKAIPERALVNVLPFSLNAGESTTAYIRIGTVQKSEALHIEPVLSYPPPNISYTPDTYKWMIYGGQAMYFIIGFYVLVFWFFVRHNSYLYFGIFCLLFGMHYSNIEPGSGYADLFLPNNPKLEIPLFTLAASGSLVFLLLFGRSFSETKGRLPFWDKYLLVVTGVYIVFFLNDLISSLSPPYGKISTSYVLAFVFVLPVSIKFLSSKHRLAKIFGTGVIWFIFWGMLGLLENQNIISLPLLPWPVGQMGLLLIYAVGLGYKLLESERQKAQAERIRKLDEVKSRFFANISHEFRTPLSLILGPVNQALESIPASESIEDAEEVPVKGRHLNIIRRNSLRLQNLVDQLLDLSKLDSGEMKLSVSQGKLVQFIRAIVFSFESLAERRHIHFHTSFPAEPEEAWFDKDKVEKILVNLLSNAFKFTPEHGKISVRVEIHKGHFTAQVSDSGPGMDTDDIDRVFSRFYQVEGTESQGTGIGLSLVKELVDLHGGQASIDSIVGKGTTFKVSLPFRLEELPEGRSKIAPSGEEATAGAAIAPELLGEEKEAEENGHPSADLPLALVVEDNPDLRHYILENIQNDYQATVAKDGQEGIRAAMEKIPDIIISDVMMPGKDGFELCATLKADHRTSHIPIILLTAKAGQQHKIEGLEQGADAYLTKPFDVRELKVRMAKLIEQRQRLKEQFAGELRLKPTEVSLASMDQRFLQSVIKQIEENIGNEYYSVEELAHSVGFSRSQLHRKLKALADKSPNQLIRDFRLARAKELLEQKSATVSEVAYQVGYSNLSYFSKSYKDAFGVSPSASGTN